MLAVVNKIGAVNSSSTYVQWNISASSNISKLMPLFFVWPVFSLPYMRFGDFSACIPLTHATT